MLRRRSDLLFRLIPQMKQAFDVECITARHLNEMLVHVISIQLVDSSVLLSSGWGGWEQTKVHTHHTHHTPHTLPSGMQPCVFKDSTELSHLGEKHNQNEIFPLCCSGFYFKKINLLNTSFALLCDCEKGRPALRHRNNLHSEWRLDVNILLNKESMGDTQHSSDVQSYPLLQYIYSLAERRLAGGIVIYNKRADGETVSD